MRISRQLQRFRDGLDLADDDPQAFFDALINEEDEGLLAELFDAWHAKGTTENELFQLASVMRDRSIRIETKHEKVVDVVGTGGSRAKAFNVSTAAAFVIAGAGVPVAKHGNGAATSISGSADVLGALGIEPAVTPAVAERCLNELGICFMFAPNFHRLSPTLAKVRRGLGYPTIFNNLGPLCNPAQVPYQLVGVYDRGLLQKTASVLSRLGTTRSWVVHGGDGLDEFTLADMTFVSEATDGGTRKFELVPEDFGSSARSISHLRPATAKDSAQMIRSILEGTCQDGAAVQLVLMNAAAPIFIAGFADTLKEAYERANDSLVKGAANAKLKELAAATT